MTDILSEKEWVTVNDILLELYESYDIAQLSRTLMKSLRKLIPYTKGCFVPLDEELNIIKEKSCFIGFAQNAEKRYTDSFYDKDYIKTLYDFVSETNVYKDTDILEKNVRERTDFYISFLKPEKSVFGCGIMIVRDDRIICEINFFRDEEWGDFNDHDVYILNIFKKHLENIICRLIRSDEKVFSFRNNIEEMVSLFGLTLRETQVLELICEGASNQTIAEKLSISISTVKKHIYNLFSKTSAENRSQLVSIVMELK